MNNNTCCFIGHRKINETEELRLKIFNTLEKLINENSVDTFFFGSKSRFNDLCYEIVSKLKEKYPKIARIYVRAEYQYISQEYKDQLLKNFEDTYYPKSVVGAGKYVYIKRNCEMINNSKFCIFYYNEECAPKNRSSGTEIAIKYAEKSNKNIIVFN